jgi:hypothetical protein
MVITFLLTFLTKRSHGLIVASIITFLFIALSYPAGGDWIGYFANYDCVVNNVCAPGFMLFEPGYELIVSIFGFLGFQAIIIAIAFINILLVCKFARSFENSVFIIFAIMCMFLWSIYIEAIRQAIAISLVMFGITYLNKGKAKQYALLVLFASCFHITALICLIALLPLYWRRGSKIVAYALLFFGMSFFFFANQILRTVLSILPGQSIASEKLEFYLSSAEYQPQLSIGSGTVLDVLLIILLILSFSRIKKQKLALNNSINDIVFLGVCLYISFGIFIGKMMPVMTRIGWYGFPFVLIALYSNVGGSIFYRGYNLTRRITLMQAAIFGYFILQIIRPFTYDYSNYNILTQESVLQNLDALDDTSLRVAAKEKCLVLTNMGYGFLCSL